MCRACLLGSQCRWIFSSSANGKLQLILAHVLGRALVRDGGAEFLCGKCVFQLEKVMQCDVEIQQIQDESNTRIQKLQAEKEHLIQCVLHVYNKNNIYNKKTSSKALQSCSPDQAPERGQLSVMRRCVSLDRLAGRGTCDRPLSLRHRSQSMYLDLVHRKGSHCRHAVKGRSTSLQCLSQPVPKLRTKGVREVREVRAASRPHSADVLRSSPPSVISDLIQLLCCISSRQICAPAGSHIPVLKRHSPRLSPGLKTGLSPSPKTRLCPGPKTGLSSETLTGLCSKTQTDRCTLQDLAAEFEDHYTPLRVQVWSLCVCGTNLRLCL